MKRIIIACLTLLGLTSVVLYAHDVSASPVPLALDAYGDENIVGLWNVLKHRVVFEPFNLVATLIFLASIIHTFCATKITRLAHHYQELHEQRVLKLREKHNLPERFVCYRAEVLHFLGEIEAVFGIWLIPLIFTIIYFHGWGGVTSYIDQRVSYVEPVFVVVIMIIASTRPVLKLAETWLRYVAAIGNRTPAAWWMTILIVGPLFGSFITEPAAMTISALLLGKQFFALKPSKGLMYGTLGLLFVNVSVGGTLTHFAAPPVLMVAGTWGWDTWFMLKYFGDKAVIAIVISTLSYYFIFRKEFEALRQKSAAFIEARVEAVGSQDANKGHPVPWFVTVMHLFFLGWTVVNLHHSALVLGGLLFFLAFTQVTLHHQYQLKLRTPLLVGFFLAGLVTHGTLQQWWISPVLSALSELPLFVGATVLTAFNDNAAITFLASLVPDFQGNVALQKAVVMGAVAGGGLTVIANAPNPAGQSILAKYFPAGVNPLKLFLGALLPTLIVAICFLYLPW